MAAMDCGGNDCVVEEWRVLTWYSLFVGRGVGEDRLQRETRKGEEWRLGSELWGVRMSRD